MNSPTDNTQIYNDLKKTASDTFNSADSFSSSDLAAQFDKGSEMIEQKVKEYATVATDYVKQNPAYAMLGAAGIGLIVGVFLARKRSTT